MTNTTTIPDCPGAPHPTPPRQALPAGACDCHLHVLGPYARYPLADVRPYTVPEAPLRDLELYMQTMGLDRVVIAHVSAHGPDHQVTLDALDDLGGRARGALMLTSSMTDDDLLSMHKRGMRGVRLSHAFGYEVSAESLAAASDRTARMGWHIAIWPSSFAELQLIADCVDRLDVPLVLDHLAGKCWTPSEGFDQPGFQLIQSMLASGKVWLKLSGMYRASLSSYPWPELIPYIRRLVEMHSDRLLWASDWPHVGLATGNMPQSAELVDWLADIGCDDEKRRQILVANPERLYGFEP